MRRVRCLGFMRARAVQVTSVLWFCVWSSSHISRHLGGSRSLFVVPAKAPTLRHPGEGRDPAPCLLLVIPAKAGIQCLGLSRQPTRIPACFARHPWRASHFLLLAQEKVTKEKAPRVERPPLRGGFATGGRVSADRPSMACSGIGAIPRADPCGAFSAALRRPTRGPGIKSKATYRVGLGPPRWCASVG